MKGYEAQKKLIDAGFVLIRQTRGSHIIFQKGTKRIVISGQGKELSEGMTGKVLSAIRVKK
jgi:predicted RNA binding protein YcfA (HicA-like mRNA interferase family)